MRLSLSPNPKSEIRNPKSEIRAPLRIAFLNPCGEIGGAERSLLLLLERLDRTRYEPRVICSAGGRLVEALAAIDVPATVVPLGKTEILSRFHRPGVRESAAAAAGVSRAVYDLTRHLRALSPDLIHTNGIKAHLLGGICGRLLRRPVLWHMRDLVPEGRVRTLFRAAAGCLPHRILCNSAAVAAQFDGSRAATRTHVIHNAVDLSHFQPARTAAAVRAELAALACAVRSARCAADSPVGPRTAHCAPRTASAASPALLAMVAHFTPWKGHMLFLEVLARLLQEGMPVTGLIVGGSIYRSEGHQEYEAEVRGRARALGLEGRVHFAGYQECVADYLNAADILIHPPVRPEPFGRALIEAMALGKPVIAAAAGGALEIIEPGVTGLLVPPGDAGAFAAATRSLLCDGPRRVAMGAQGRARVTREFTPELHVERIERVYQEMLG